jgi:cellulose synthase/poly-beta-1,6-N-acetylglucosamine synthase-like glycosyltransferase
MRFYTSAEEVVETRGDYLAQRFLEIMPGLLVWAMLALPVVLFFAAPRLAVYVLAVYVIYWVVRIFEMAGRQTVEMFTLWKHKKTDWPGRLRKLSTDMRASGEEGPFPEDVVHLVILATYNERVEILEQSLDSVLAADYPEGRVVACLAVEERSKTWDEETLARFRARYGDRFLHFLTITHPDGIPGEGRVKGANLTWAARRAREELHRQGITDSEVIVSAFDADTRTGRDYFGVLTYKYLTDPNRDVNSYQSVLMYHNNIWDVPTVSRLAAFCSTFWTMVESTRPERLRIFSSHAMGMPALVHSGFWSRVVIPDDSRQYWRMFFASNGRSRTVPLHTPLYMDAVLSTSTRATLKEQYLQLLRWAYGVIDFPYIMGQNLRNGKIPVRTKFVQTFRQFMQYNSWASAPFVLLLAPRLLGFLKDQVPSVGLEHLLIALGSQLIFILPLGLVVSVVSSLLILPPRPAHHTKWGRLRIALEWLTLPFVLLAFICWPAVDAQTRLLFGRYMGFRVTVKERRSLAHEVR